MALHEPPLGVPFVDPKTGFANKPWVEWLVLAKTEKVDRIEDGVENSITTLKSNGQIQDSGIALADISGDITAILAGLDNVRIISSKSDSTLEETELIDWVANGGGLTISSDGSGGITVKLSNMNGTKILASNGSGSLQEIDLADWISQGTGITITNDGDGSVSVLHTSQGNASDLTSIVTTYTITDPTDNASTTALMSDLVTNTIPSAEAHLSTLAGEINVTNTKMNSVLSLLASSGIITNT